jgi:hypothetical protein
MSRSFPPSVVRVLYVMSVNGCTANTSSRTDKFFRRRRENTQGNPQTFELSENHQTSAWKFCIFPTCWLPLSCPYAHTVFHNYSLLNSIPARYYRSQLAHQLSCHGPDGQSPVSHSGGSCSILDQTMWH